MLGVAMPFRVHDFAYVLGGRFAYGYEGVLFDQGGTGFWRGFGGFDYDRFEVLFGDDVEDLGAYLVAY